MRVLQDCSERVSGQGAVEVHDLGGGKWRSEVFESTAEWPAVAGIFERLKYRIILESGDSLLWKFHGFRPALKNEADASRWAPRDIETCCGFTGMTWEVGRPLSPADSSLELMRSVGEYISAVQGPALSGEQLRNARSRLVEILYWNTREELGVEEGERVREWAETVELSGAPSYGDGHLAPYEWLRTPEGLLRKTDYGGHSGDHTAVGNQTVAWDVAGAAVEWGWAHSSEFREFCPAVDGQVLKLHLMAYAAFRMGLFKFCASQERACDERTRLDAAYSGYRGQLTEQFRRTGIRAG